MGAGFGVISSSLRFHIDDLSELQSTCGVSLTYYRPAPLLATLWRLAPPV